MKHWKRKTYFKIYLYKFKNQAFDARGNLTIFAVSRTMLHVAQQFSIVPNWYKILNLSHETCSVLIIRRSTWKMSLGTLLTKLFSSPETSGQWRHQFWRFRPMLITVDKMSVDWKNKLHNMFQFFRDYSLASKMVSTFKTLIGPTIQNAIEVNDFWLKISKMCWNVFETQFHINQNNIKFFA